MSKGQSNQRSAGCVSLDIDGVAVQVRLAPGRTVADLTEADRAALESLVVQCRQRGCCPVCHRSVRLVRQGSTAVLHLDGAGRNCPGSGEVIA